jgi:hypothetical protein
LLHSIQDGGMWRVSNPGHFCNGVEESLNLGQESNPIPAKYNLRSSLLYCLKCNGFQLFISINFIILKIIDRFLLKIFYFFYCLVSFGCIWYLTELLKYHWYWNVQFLRNPWYLGVSISLWNVSRRSNNATVIMALSASVIRKYVQRDVEEPFLCAYF